MKIGVLSDTHISSPVDGLPPDVLRTFRAQNVGLILHAGDLVDLCVIDMLSSVAEVRAVAGNMDSLAVRAVLPAKRIEQIGGVRVGIIHGSGPPQWLGERLLPVFDGDRIRVLVYGHSHEPRNEEAAGVPGMDVRAAKSGIVLEVTKLGVWNCLIVIDHGKGEKTVYGHIDKAAVAAGDRVKQGQVIGTLADVGREGKTVLHFRIYRDGEPIDPQGKFSD